jgi:hydantoinase/carbamoylase family amidase
MPIKPDRISRDIEIIAGFNETTPTVGYSRPTFSKSWRKARDYIVAQAEAAGCKTRIDAFGNLHARHRSIDWGAQVWLSGSHIDSVPTGGKFDGVVGVLCPLEVLRAGHEANQVIPLELVVFAEEEGTTFGLGMIGSRLWTGDATADSIESFLNSDAKKNYVTAGKPHGVRPEAFAADRFNPSHYRGLIEIHIEQGPAMWENQIPIAVVAAISGRQQYKVELKGVPNHAGSTPMSYRWDALTAAARIILDLERMAPELSDQTVATVGRIECQPNAINVIPGSVSFTVDLRSPGSDDLFDAHNRLDQMIRESPAKEASLIKIEDQPVVEMDAELVARLMSAAGARVPTTVSGALHDAAILAPHLPTAMLFVASRDGISHNPAEFSRIEDIAAAARVLGKAVQPPN